MMVGVVCFNVLVLYEEVSCIVEVGGYVLVVEDVYFEDLVVVVVVVCYVIVVIVEVLVWIDVVVG